MSELLTDPNILVELILKNTKSSKKFLGVSGEFFVDDNVLYKIQNWSEYG